jgi:hypothetical protein
MIAVALAAVVGVAAAAVVAAVAAVAVAVVAVAVDLHLKFSLIFMSGRQTSEEIVKKLFFYQDAK